MTEYFTKDIVIDLLKKEKPGKTPHEKLTKILDVMNRGTMLSASDLRYIKSRQVKEKAECEYVTANGGCRLGIGPKCPAIKGWKKGIMGCAAYLEPLPSDGKNNPLEPQGE